MNINSLDSFIQQTFNKIKDTSNQRSQNDIAISIGNAKSQQTQKAQMTKQIQQTLQQRQNSNSQTASQSATNKNNSEFTFSIYV